MPVGTEKTAILGAAAGGYEYAAGQNGPGYSLVSGFNLGYGNHYASCGNGGGGTWSWSEPVCPTSNPDSPGSYGGYHGDHYRNQPNGGSMEWAYSMNGSSWTNVSNPTDSSTFSNMCGTGYRHYYCNNSGEIFAPYWRCTGSATGRWDFSLNLFIKW